MRQSINSRNSISVGPIHSGIYFSQTTAIQLIALLSSIGFQQTAHTNWLSIGRCLVSYVRRISLVWLVCLEDEQTKRTFPRWFDLLLVGWPWGTTQLAQAKNNPHKPAQAGTISHRSGPIRRLQLRFSTTFLMELHNVRDLLNLWIVWIVP